MRMERDQKDLQEELDRMNKLNEEIKTKIYKLQLLSQQAIEELQKR